MDIFLAIISGICLIVGLVGAVLPLPGPPLSFIGLLILHYTKYVEFDSKTLFGYGLATIAVTIFDYFVPIWGTKKFGGTKYGTWGSTLGLLIGMFFGPFGIFVGAFIGAMAGELLGGSASDKAFKAAIGSFVGFVAGIIMKVALCIIMILQVVWAFN